MLIHSFSGISSEVINGMAVSSVMHFAHLSENAITPTKGSALAAGYDLYSAYDCVIPAKGCSVCMTDLQVAIPQGCYGHVAPRSGLAIKFQIDVGAGVIDADYRGNVGIVLFNLANTDFRVKHGDRIAQLICECILMPKLEECKMLGETTRGIEGFGSTGR